MATIGFGFSRRCVVELNHGEAYDLIHARLAMLAHFTEPLEPHLTRSDLADNLKRLLELVQELPPSSFEQECREDLWLRGAIRRWLRI